MNWNISKFFVITLVLCVSGGMVFAQSGGSVPEGGEFTFTIAPPPVGYPVFEPGQTIHSVRGTYLGISNDDKDYDWRFDGVIGSYARQSTYSPVFTYNRSTAAGVLVGDVPGADVTMVPIVADFTPILRPYYNENLDVLAFGMLGTNATISIMEFDDFDLQSQMLQVLIVPGGGLQANIGVGDFVVSPFGVYRYSVGGYMVEYSGDFYEQNDYLESDSDSIDGYGSLIFGFDLLYKPYNISLSSFVQQEEEVTIVTISLGFSFTTGEG